MADVSQAAIDAAVAAEFERVVAALKTLHRSFGIYEECGCQPGEHDDAEVVNCGDFETCLEPLWFVCAHCCRDLDNSYQFELCHDTHEHGPGQPICETARLIADLREVTR